MRRERQKRRAKAGRKLRYRFRAHAGFSAGELRRVSGEKVIHGLLGHEARDGWQNPKGIGGKKHDMARMAADSWNDGILDELDGVRRTGVLSDLNIRVIGLAGDRVEHHILEHRSITNRVKDLRLFFFAQVDAFGITAALKIEHPRRAPAMLVI